MKKFLFLSAFALAVAMLSNGCSRGGGKATGGAGVPVLVAQAFTTNVPVQIDPPPVGHVVPYSTVTVHSQIGGIISEVYFKEGDEVKSNALLFTIDPRPVQAALASARAALARDQAQLENAKIQFGREQKLFDQKLVSQDEFDTSRASMDALVGTVAADQAAVTNAMLNLEFTAIRSPIDGVVGALQLYQGNVVKAPDDVLLTINQIHPIYVEFAVPEQYLPEIRKEMRTKTLKVSVTFQNMDGPPAQGELTFINNSVDETTGTIDLKATFPNENNALWPGQFVNVTLTLSELTNVVVVPSQAVQTGQNGEYLYAVKSNQTDQTVEEQRVTVGVTYQGVTVIKSGVQAGETVVTDGQLRLAPGVTVSVNAAGPAGSSTNSPANPK
jgi:multidrug efflux system membrane fusion protein